MKTRARAVPDVLDLFHDRIDRKLSHARGPGGSLRL